MKEKQIEMEAKGEAFYSSWLCKEENRNMYASNSLSCSYVLCARCGERSQGKMLRVQRAYQFHGARKVKGYFLCLCSRSCVIN